MVLQRGKPVPVWGESSGAQSVRVFLENEPLCTLHLDSSGAFRVSLPALRTAEGITLRFVCADGCELILENVDVGEVWLAGGQSNMEFPLRYDAQGKRAVAAANDPHLRLYTVPRYAFDGEVADGFADDRAWGKWLPATSETAGDFSAVAYYFAQELRQSLHVPVGIVSCNWGGTTASTWLDPSYLRRDEALHVYLTEYDDAVRGQDVLRYYDADRAYRGRKKTFRDTLNRYAMEGSHRLLRTVLEGYMRSAPLQPMGPRHHNSPGRLYRSMLAKISGFACRGVLWYQGESDMPHAEVYDRLFGAVIDCWRRDWNEELPFLFVQLAPFDRDCGFIADGFPEIRRRQAIVEAEKPHVWMSTIMDVGMAHDIHPKEKRPVGHRLALLAGCKIYGEDILCQDPQLCAARRHDDAVTLQFAHAGNGLYLRGKHLRALHVLADGARARGLRVEVSGDTITLRAAALRRASRLTLSFAETPYCRVNLYNSAACAARPFFCEITSVEAVISPPPAAHCVP